MKRGIAVLILLAAAAAAAQTPEPGSLDGQTAERFARLALACVNKEYPNKIAHVLNSDADVAPPRQLTPAFYGCYDWHSSVHGHWLLARLVRTFPNAPFTVEARAALQKSLTPEHIRQEVAYLNHEGNAAFERPYGLAWLILLHTELSEWRESATHVTTTNSPVDPLPRELARTLEPLQQAARTRLMTWLPKLANPVRIGEHNQTAFAFSLLIDSARITGDQEFLDLLLKKAREFYLNDKDCPLAYEPSGEDFLSPCLAEADVMRRVLTGNDYAAWLATFMPQIPRDGGAGWLKPVVVTDPTDPKLGHLDGLNLSRAWMLEGIASGLPPQSRRVPALRAAAKAHADAGLAAVTGAHYEGGHWLGSFATYLVTRRGLGR